MAVLMYVDGVGVFMIIGFLIVYALIGASSGN